MLDVVDNTVVSVLSRVHDEDRLGSEAQAVVPEGVGVVDAQSRVVLASASIDDSGTELEPKSSAEGGDGKSAQRSVDSWISPSSTGGEDDMEARGGSFWRLG